MKFLGLCRMWAVPFTLAGLGSSIFGVGLADAAVTRQVTVVELFTSQGCSSVPQANRNLAALASRPDLLPLSFSVTYWDYLGWKDTFGSEEFTKRQRSYEAGLGHDAPFTPQIVVNGSADTVGRRMDEVESLLKKSSPPKAVAIDIEDDVVQVGQGSSPTSVADIWLVHYRPGVQKVSISAGENSGTTLPVANVVTDVRLLTHWTGAGTSLKVPAQAPGVKTAVIIQVPNGQIISAATN